MLQDREDKDMRLHEDKDIFESTLNDLEDRTGYRAAVLEKDYYVVLMLKELSEKQAEGLPAYFKGGTALYKSLKNAKRFSEDIDLSVDTRGCSDSQNKKRLNLATKSYTSMVRNEGEGRTNKSEVITYYGYEPVTRTPGRDRLSRFGKVMIEATSFTISEPIYDMEITPLIYDLASEKEILSVEYDISPFTVKAITTERIFIDKLFATEAYARKASEPEKAFDAAKHIYDLSVMADMPNIQALLSNEDDIKKLLDIRMEEELGRLDGIPGVKPSEFEFFSSILGNAALEKAYKDMLSVYVFNETDRTPYADAVSKIAEIHDRLLENMAWTDYKVSVLAKLESKKKEAEDHNKSVQNKDRSRSEEIE